MTQAAFGALVGVSQQAVGNLVGRGLLDSSMSGQQMLHAYCSHLRETAAALQVAMGLQKDGTGSILNLDVKTLIVPRALRGTANVVRESEFEVGAANKNNTVPNSVRSTFDVVADARLDANSATAWYGVASKDQHDCIEVQYLDGNEAPTLEQQNGWHVDGVEFKVRMAGSHTNEIGKAIPFKFTLICDRLNAADLKAALGSGDTQVDEFVASVATGWRDQRLVLEDDDTPADFCTDALEALLNISGLGMLCFTAYMKEAGAKAKN